MNEIINEAFYSFEYKNDTYEVRVKNLEIEQDEYNIFLYADDIKAKINGRDMTPDDFGTTWAGHKMSESDLLQQSLALYVNGNKTFSMHKSLDEFDNIYYSVHKKGTIKGINEAYLSLSGYIMHLQFATEIGSGYADIDGRVAVIDNKSKELITDMEHFYTEYVVNALKNNVKFIYKAKGFDEWISDYI